MAGKKVLTYVSKLWPKSTNLNEIQIDFLKEFPLENEPLNGLTFNGAYMPEEIMVNIFAHLSPKDILKCSLVCKSWFNIAKSNALWQTIYNRKEHPKKAKNLPWYVFYCYLTTENFKNLIRNGNGEEGFNYWNTVFKDGDQFIIEEPILPSGSGCWPLPLNVPEFHGHTTCFAASYSHCLKYQEINLNPKRLLRHIIRKYRPVLYASEWYTGHFGCGCSYILSIVCDLKVKETKNIHEQRLFKFNCHGNDGTNLFNILHTKSVKGEIQEWEPNPWEKLEVLYEDYPKEVETVSFFHTGRVTKFYATADHYGAKMAGGILKFLFDSIKPTPEDVFDEGDETSNN